MFSWLIPTRGVARARACVPFSILSSSGARIPSWRILCFDSRPPRSHPPLCTRLNLSFDDENPVGRWHAAAKQAPPHTRDQTACSAVLPVPSGPFAQLRSLKNATQSRPDSPPSHHICQQRRPGLDAGYPGQPTAPQNCQRSPRAQVAVPGGPGACLLYTSPSPRDRG